MPQTPKYLLGLINLRGKALPVIDLRVKFGVENREITINSCILILEININGKKTKVGALVDEVSEVFDVQEEHVKTPPNIGLTVHNSYISGIYEVDISFIMLLNIENVFADQKIDHVEELNKSEVA